MSKYRFLFSCLSGKIALYQSIKDGLSIFEEKIDLIGGDSNKNCKAANSVDEFVQIPPLKVWSENEVIDFCERHGISHVIPSSDLELQFWSNLKPKLLENKVSVMVSSTHALSKCLDKYSFFPILGRKPSHIQTIPTCARPEFLNSDKFVVKERYGNGSNSIGLNLPLDLAKSHAKKLQSPIFQPFIEGRELSAETWIDQYGKCHGMLLRWRIKIVNGESYESEVFKDQDLADQITETLEEVEGLAGHVLSQVIITPEGTPKLVEINPRLGGASPLALQAGINSPLWFLQETTNQSEMIPHSPKIMIGAKLFHKEGSVQVELPFDSRHDDKVI